MDAALIALGLLAALICLVGTEEDPGDEGPHNEG